MNLSEYVHDLPLRERPRRHFVRYATSWGETHGDEFDDAFPDEIPPSQERGADAA
ncbi:hypothetical protein LRE75_35930 [Streptomyces sp. 372A]|uniref:hypothetical protein n=1 Tax=Streptomyces sp. SAS_281 TaxID=3412744 RepID=UPI00403D40D6